jgi:hypothetical protein
MSVIALSAVQEQVRTLIAASAYFADVTVLADDGTKFPEEEDALRNTGHCVTVLPLLDGQTVGNATGSAILSVSIAVRVAINPELATLDIYEMVSQVIAAVLNYGLANKQDRFELARGAKCFTVDDSDPGLMAYIVFFDKAAYINHTT